MTAVSVLPRKMTRATILKRLQAHLLRFTSRSATQSAWAAIGWAFVSAVLATLLVGWVDLLVDLPPALRIVLLLGVLATPIVVGRWFYRRSRRQSSLQQLTQRVDQVLESHGEVSAGVDLSQSQAAAGHAPPLTQGLTLLAMLRAAGLLSTVAIEEAVPGTQVAKALASAGAAACFSFLLTVSLPGLVWTETLRFLDPLGDHPSWSRLTFAISPGDIEVPYADRIDIDVQVTGPNPERVELVIERTPQPVAADRQPTPPTEDREILPMFEAGDGNWRASLAQVTSPAKYYVRSGNARSRRHQIDLIYVPEIEEVRFRIIPPAYTRRAPFEGPLPPGGLSGLPGTIVEVTAKSNRPLSGGTVQLFSEAGSNAVALLASANDPNVALGSFPIETAGRMELHVRDTEQRHSREPFQAPISLLADQTPFVRLLEPRAVSFATPDAVLPVMLAAEDDYGLATVELFRNLNNSSYRPQSLTIADPPPTRVNEVVMLPLSAYRLEPGDELRLFVRVTDNDPAPPVPGLNATATTGKGSETAVAVIQIIARSEFDRMQQTRETLETLLSKYQQAQRRVESLQEELEQLRKELENEPADSPLSEERQEQLEQMEQRLAAEADALEKLADHKLPFALDEELTPELQKLAKQVRDSAEALAKRSPSQTGQEAREQLDQLQQELKKGEEQLQEETGPSLELLSKVFPLMENEARFGDLAGRQRDLAERLRSLRDQENPDQPAARARMRELEAEQRALREELTELTQQIRERAESLPEEEGFDELRQTALDFAEALQKSGAAGKMGEAEQGLGQFSGSTGFEAAQKAAELLESLMSKCDGMGEAGGSCPPKFQPKHGNSLQQTMQQLLQQMGLKPGNSDGNGSGTGGGSGYSASRSTSQNVGLYGSEPMVDQSSAARSGPPGDRNAKGARGSQDSSTDRDPRDGGLSFRRRIVSGGSGDLAVPPRYRDRVGRYFQRLADELGER